MRRTPSEPIQPRNELVEQAYDIQSERIAYVMPPESQPEKLLCSIRQTVHHRVYEKVSRRVFHLKLKNAGVSRVLDVRLNNSSQLAGFTKKDDLEFFKAVAGIDYAHLSESRRPKTS